MPRVEWVIDTFGLNVELVPEDKLIKNCPHSGRNKNYGNQLGSECYSCKNPNYHECHTYDLNKLQKAMELAKLPTKPSMLESIAIAILNF